VKLINTWGFSFLHGNQIKAIDTTANFFFAAEVKLGPFINGSLQLDTSGVSINYKID